MTEPSISLARIEAAEKEMISIRTELAALGRELYFMREGKALSSDYRFDGYEQDTFCGTNYSGQEGPDWGIGTPILSLRFFWSWNGGGEYEYITLPINYLGCDWRDDERARLAEEARKTGEAADREKQLKKEQREANELATYERLREKFEGNKT